MKKLAISLFIGILCIGFGAGIMAVEVMNFTFGGEKFLPKSNPNIVSEKRYETIHNNDGNIMVRIESNDIANVVVVSDDTLSPNQICFDYTLDKNNYYLSINSSYSDDREDDYESLETTAFLCPWVAFVSV